MHALIGHANFPFQSAIDSTHSLKALKLPLFSLKNTFTTYILHVTSSFGKNFIYLFRNEPNIIVKAVIIGHYHTKHLDSCTCSLTAESGGKHAEESPSALHPATPMDFRKILYRLDSCKTCCSSSGDEFGGTVCLSPLH